MTAPPPSRPPIPGAQASPSAQALYRQRLTRFQQAYAAWQAARSKPVAAAEAVLQEEKDKFGNTYDVNVAHRWLILAGISVILVAAILLIQKAKDQV